jgi:5-methylcytosine-specific restriction protein B
MFWHGSTDYSDTIEGISAVVTPDGKIDYSVLPGMIKQLADSSTNGPKLMIIEGINKSNPAEALGELITLLEPDKRSLHIEGYDGDIQLPDNMYFICTCNPIVENQYKLDSAMKRRFVIANVYPDYKLLSMHLNVDDAPVDIENLSLDNTDDNFIKHLAIQLLKKINASISYAVGENYQVGHSVFWNLDNDCSLATLLETFDNIILPLIEELCFDADVAERIFGVSSPAISILPYGVEIQRLSTLTKQDLIEALKGLLSHD